MHLRRGYEGGGGKLYIAWLVTVNVGSASIDECLAMCSNPKHFPYQYS